MTCNLMLGDCLERMREIPDGSVDMVLCDLPYGTTACKWDVLIPFDKLWEQYRRVCKPSGAIVLTASQPFTTLLVGSQIGIFRYSWVWEKEQGSNFQHAKRQPLKVHEDICVFYKDQCVYNPQGLQDCNIVKSNKGKGGNLGHCSSESVRSTYTQSKTGYPRSVQKFSRDRGLHPTQKPVGLCEYLIKTYTQEGEVVLDNTMGSGTTGVACVNTGRNFIGIEKDEGYFNIAKERIDKAMLPQDIST